MKKTIIILLVLMFPLVNAVAQSRKTIDFTTDVAMFLPVALGAGVSLCKGDYEGFLELGKSVAVSTAVTYILKYSVKKLRPDGSGFDAFPSNHNNFVFAGSTFLMKRYGWKWGVPAYLVSGYVAWGRIYAQKHDIWDVLAGAAVGVGSGLLFTTPFAKKHDVALMPTVMADGSCGIYFSMGF